MSYEENGICRKAVTELLQHMCKKAGIDCTNMLTSLTGSAVPVFLQKKSNPRTDFFRVFRLSEGENCCVESSAMDVLLQHEPQPTSTKNMIHLSQSKNERPRAFLQSLRFENQALMALFLVNICSDKRREYQEIRLRRRGGEQETLRNAYSSFVRNEQNPE